MATRRNVAAPDTAAAEPQEKSIVPTTPDGTRHSDGETALQHGTVYKLLLFTFAMITLPLTSYFVVVRVLNSNSFWGAVTAALVANLVLVGYILVAVEEDQGDQRAAKAKEEGKKAR